MGKKIYKYCLPVDGNVITINANIIKWLNIKTQDGEPYIWAVVDDAGYSNEYEIIAWGTGWDYPEELNRCRYMGTAIDGNGYVWHYFMQETSKSWSIAETAIATAPVEGIDYWNGLLTTTPATVQDYTVTISCGEADSAISALETKVSNTTDLNLLNELASYIEGACSTAAIKGYT